MRLSQVTALGAVAGFGLLLGVDLTGTGSDADVSGGREAPGSSALTAQDAEPTPSAERDTAYRSGSDAEDATASGGEAAPAHQPVADEKGDDDGRSEVATRRQDDPAGTAFLPAYLGLGALFAASGAGWFMTKRRLAEARDVVDN